MSSTTPSGVVFFGLVVFHACPLSSPAVSRPEVDDLLEPGSVHTSPGGQYSFRVIAMTRKLY